MFYVFQNYLLFSYTEAMAKVVFLYLGTLYLWRLGTLSMSLCTLNSP